MKRVTLIMFVVSILSLIGLTGASTQTGRLPIQKTTDKLPQITLERTATTQQRLNRYFHSQVMPTLKNCWTRVQGRGTIEIEHLFTRDGDNWIAGKLTVAKYSLPREQVGVALQCMQNAVRGTSFPAEAGDGEGNSYLANWTWPVPFPPDAERLTSAMFSSKPKGGGGGCDGRGSLPKCFFCETSKTCKKVCVGFKNCVLEVSAGRYSCDAKESCASGGPFGVTGGTVIQ